MTQITGRRASLIVLDDVDDTYTAGPLTRALALWREGRGISMVLAAELLAEGYNVQALERRHRA